MRDEDAILVNNAYITNLFDNYLGKKHRKAGASSFSTYSGGIEIEVDTRQDHRRKGLATACAARLILACLDRGWYPSWDAQNVWSVGLAEKLGYRFSHTYTAFEITEEDTSISPHFPLR